MTKSLTFEYVKKYIESFGYQLLSTEYKNCSSLLSISCPNDHIFSMNFNSFSSSGHRCKKCYDGRKYNKETVKSTLSSFGYKLISENYINSLHPITIECDRGHRYSIKFTQFVYGYRCKKCLYKSQIKYTEMDAKNIYIKDNYKLITPYIGFEKENIIECPNGHQYKMTLAHFLDGRRCKRCHFDKQLISIGEIEKTIQDRNYKLLKHEKIYYSNKLQLLCPKGHVWNTTLGNFNKPQNCPHCQHPLIIQNKCKTIIESVLLKKFPTIKPDFMISPKTGRRLELDGYCEELNLAFETDGPGHSIPIYGEDRLAQQQARDRLKDILCRKNDVYLIRIPYTVENKEEFIQNEINLYNLCGLS